MNSTWLDPGSEIAQSLYPHVEPVAVAFGCEGEVVVEVHQVVLDLNGNLLADQMVGHVFRIENGLIKRFDIRGV